MAENKASSAKHKLYTRNSFAWKSVRDSIEGPNAVKRENELYLPMPQGFLNDTSSASSSSVGTGSNASTNLNLADAPYYHRNKAYMSYLHRARFPEITFHTLRGLFGIATKTDPVIELPDKLSYLEDNCTKDGKSLKELFSQCLIEVLSQGRITLVLDVNETDNTFYIATYSAPSFINWIDDDVTGDTSLAVFQETDVVLSDAENYETKEEQTTIVYKMQVKVDSGNEEEVLHVIKYTGDINLPETITPNLQGVHFDSLPIVTIGSLVNRNDPNPAPLFGVSEIGYAIYRKDADLSQAEYMTCNPMFVITGAQSDGVPVTYGSTVALILENPAATAFFPATDTSALAHVAGQMEKMKEEAANYGANILGPTKKAAEANDTLKTRQGAQGATLVGSVENISKGIENILKMAAELSKADPEKVSFKASTDFSERNLSPQMLTALVGSWNAGAYSKMSLLGVMQESGLFSSEDDVEDEISRIESEPPRAADGPISDQETDEE